MDSWTNSKWADNRGTRSPSAPLAASPDDAVDVPGAIAPDVRRARAVAKLFDDTFLDPLLGFVLPGVGDLVGSLVGLWIVSIAVRRRLPAIVIARMLLNLSIDAVVGVVPIIGDAADVAFRANRRNVALLEARIERQSSWRDWLVVAGAFALFAATCVLTIWTVVRLLDWVF
ncbi:MAG: DUF4112 domain-containing protein [Deltaproteobacteria bacterium]|nr:DUF4112 domain-containing protein [Deltaproteobacteria bacterium]